MTSFGSDSSRSTMDNTHQDLNEGYVVDDLPIEAEEGRGTLR